MCRNRGHLSMKDAPTGYNICFHAGMCTQYAGHVFGLRAGISADNGKAVVAYALFVTAVVFANAAIANNNLQDLKTGQLVDATPWKQQVALVIGAAPRIESCK